MISNYLELFPCCFKCIDIAMEGEKDREVTDTEMDRQKDTQIDVQSDRQVRETRDRDNR